MDKGVGSVQWKFTGCKTGASTAATAQKGNSASEWCSAPSARRSLE